MALLLNQLSKGIVFIGQPVHATLFPYPIAATFHAARISVVYQGNSRAATAATNTKIPWPTYLAGYLIMAPADALRAQTWGGTVITHQLMQLPPPMLYSPNPYTIYLTTHLVMTLFFHLFPSLLSPTLFAFLDTVLFPLDALVRTAAVTGTTSLLTLDSSIARPLTTSPITHLIIGAFASAGGGLTASTLSTWSPSWSFSTPPVLRAQTLSALAWGSMDIWGGALVATVYGTASGSEAFHGVQALVRTAVIALAGTGIAQGEFALGAAWVPPLEAKALAAGVLAVCFGLRAYKTHWAAPVAPPAKQAKNVFKGKAQ
ncbi:hypothetical protein DXG03_005500 [Asterophora parasitica]|uniref:Uncharacterized protein n=1 Tax=Asterophora parasitica TaxID=117018 RepID=A0A9P7GBG5_9AGAR|nr:hypothetical protein DXG03_005500 [Asterophora parasitica]